MKRFLPLILIFRDKTIDMKNLYTRFDVPSVYISKKRTLTFINIPDNCAFKFCVNGNITMKGNIVLMRVAQKLSDLVEIDHNKIIINKIK